MWLKEQLKDKIQEGKQEGNGLEKAKGGEYKEKREERVVLWLMVSDNLSSNLADPQYFPFSTNAFEGTNSLRRNKYFSHLSSAGPV